MANNKKGGVIVNSRFAVQRGCAKRSLAKAKTYKKNKSVKQRGGDLHKMYNYNNLQVDPQRMITMDNGTVGSQTGGSQTVYKGTGGKHRHSRKYYKRSRGGALTGGALNFSAVDNLVYNATVPMLNNSTSIQTNMKVPAHV